MIGILMAGGLGKRLQPSTSIISKHLFPIYDKPMIYYSLSLFLMAKIKEVIIISDQKNLTLYEELLGNGKRLGMNFTYINQPKPEGIAQGILLSRDKIQNKKICLILGDNILYGNNLIHELDKAKKNKNGASIFAYYVDNPSEYGVVEFDNKFKIKKIIEKPKKNISNYAIHGIYFYDNQVVKIAEAIKKSNRNEYEITSINRAYLKKDMLRVNVLSRGFAWLDTGSVENLNAASNFFATIERRQGLKIGCLEEIAYNNKWIDKKQLLEIIRKMSSHSEYAKYLRRIVS